MKDFNLRISSLHVALNKVLHKVLTLSEIIHLFVYLGYFHQFKETAVPSTLTHWLDFLTKAKILNPKIWIQWGIVQAWRLLQCQLFWLLGAFSQFWKTGCESLEDIFCNFWWVAKWVMALLSIITGTQLVVEIQPLPVTFRPKIDSQMHWLTSDEWYFFLSNSQKLTVKQPESR